MTYARARLWLGITGVGTIVLLSVAMLAAQVPHRLLPDNESWRTTDLVSLFGFVMIAQALMAPFDLLGGYVAPRRFGRSEQRFSAFLVRWAFGVAIQTVLFVLAGAGILAAGRYAGVGGSIGVVIGLVIAYLLLQEGLTRLLTNGHWIVDTERLDAVMRELEKCGLRPKRTIVIDNADPGFTGGIAGLPGFETIVVPRQWLELLSKEQLVAAIGRRLEATESGSRTRGLLVALTWIVSGFVFACLLPGAGVASVSQLVTTCCGFTCWTFLGLLILPTVSRQASYAVDSRVIKRGLPETVLNSLFATLDEVQDDEPQRAALIETIFHPVPSLENRRNPATRSHPDAWHAARMTLFLSWSCMGLLSRAVHCNAGRPELWAMLPAD